MMPVNIKVLGLSATPIKGGNCDTMVQEALKTAAQVPGVETEFITLADKQVAMCQHCQWGIDSRFPGDGIGTRSGGPGDSWQGLRLRGRQRLGYCQRGCIWTKASISGA